MHSPSKRLATLLGPALVLCASGCGSSGGDGSDSSGDSTDPAALSGGDLTLFNATSEAFASPAPNLSEAALDKHLAGDFDFEQQFVTAGNTNNPGLGPIFNHDACINCHTKDGRGRPVDDQGQPTQQIFLRLSCSGMTDSTTGGPYPVPNFGGQLQTEAIHGVDAEANLAITYSDLGSYPDGTPTEYGDGTDYTLRKPSYQIQNPYTEQSLDAACGDNSSVLTSPRVAPPVHGVGLLEAIPDSRLQALADPNDSDGDGVSGRLNQVWAIEAGETTIGRIGWKANNPSIRQQNAGAYNEDMGVTNPVLPEESAKSQNQYDHRDDDPEIDEEILHDVTFYVQTLAVPARRDLDDPQVQRGEELFTAAISDGGAGCARCHVQTQTTYSADNLPDQLPDAVAGQTIHPYTDLLLHDMGPALADGRPDFEANGREWRTPPLWGIGLTEVVNGHTRFLHDGRARSLPEAILWHGGEAKDSREAFRTMNKSDREALIAFLRSL